MNIGILETEHFEGAYPVIKLFDMPENKLILFTDFKTQKRFLDIFKSQKNNYKWVIEDPEKNRFHFFLKIYIAAKKHKLDLLYVNTISNNHLLYGLMIKFLSPLRVILTIHDINCLFESRINGIRETIQHAGKRLLLKQVREFNVVSDTMIDYLQKKDNRIIIHNIPGAVFEYRIPKNEINDHVHLVVPGSIDERRRDYEKVFALIHAAEENEVPISITLLGGAKEQYGDSIISRAKNYNGNYTRLKYYDEKIIGQDEFDEQLDSAHFIFIPSVVHTIICNQIPEIYGITKSSGNIFDVIKHAKPFIAPQELVTPVDLKDSRFSYQTILQLVIFLKKLLQAPEEYHGWREKAILNSKKFTIERIRGKNPLLFAMDSNKS